MSASAFPAPPVPLAFLSEGDMGRRIRDHAWLAANPGPVASWPETLKITVGLMLGSRFPMFVTWGPDDALLYNDAYAEILAHRHPGALGRPLREVWPEIRDEIDPLAASARAGQACSSHDMPFVLTRRGVPERAWFTFSLSPVRDTEGAIRGLFCTCTETTSRVLAEGELRASEARTRGVLEGMKEGFAILDTDFRILQVNAETLRLDDREASEIVGRTHWEAYPGSERSPLGDLYRKAMRERVPVTLEHRHAWPDGNASWLEMRAYPTGEGLAVFYRDVTRRREREDALVEAETRLRALADNLPGGCAFQIACPRDNSYRRFVYLSKGFEALTGVTAEAAMADAEAVYGLIPPDYRAAVDAIEADNVRYLRPFDGEVPMVRPDGSLVWGRSISAPRVQPDGSLIFDGIMLDETARKVAEGRLRESEAKFQAIADSIEQMVWSALPDGCRDYHNQRWTEFTGLPAEATGAGDIEGVIHGDDRKRVAAAWERCLSTGEAYREEYRLRHRSGEYRWVLGRAQAVRGESGGIVRWFGTYTDIQEIVEAREILAHSRGELEREVAERTRELNQVWRLSHDLFTVLGADGVHRRVNPAWAQALGLPPDSVVGQRFEAFVHPEDREAAADALARAASGETVRDVTVRMRTLSGQDRWYGWALVPEGDTVYAAGRDVTDQRLTEEALRQAQKMEAVGQLTGGLAHDFNNLLTGIVGSLEMMQTRVAQGRFENVERYATAAMSSANRAAALTHRLLAFARRQPLDPKPVDANRLVTSLEDLIRRTTGEMIAVEMVTAAGLWPTLCDPHQLESAVLNLAINARDAMPDGGSIVVETCNTHLDPAYARRNPGVDPGAYVCVSVRDTGAGMAPNVVSRAFDPFFTTKPFGQGTGLGLSMIYGFARQSGGHARIESQPGHGTTVRIYLPRHRGEGPGEETTEGGMIEAHRAEVGETVLVVEDEFVVRELIVEVLGDLGYRALQAADGPSGLRVLQTDERIDLLVTDVGLPGMNGRQMADQAREGRPDLKVLFITGYAENATFGKGAMDPGTQLVTKPFTVEALAARIKEMIQA